MAGWPVATAFLDGLTAFSAGWNSLYFLGRLMSGEPRSPARTIALALLSLTFVALAVEAAALLVVRAIGDAAALDAPGWTAVRALPAAASIAVTALIVRKGGGR